MSKWVSKRASERVAFWPAGGARTFVHLSSHFVLRHSSVSGVARGRNHTRSFHLVFVCHSFGLAYLAQNFHFMSAMTHQGARTFVIIITNVIKFHHGATKICPKVHPPLYRCEGVCLCLCVGVCLSVSLSVSLCVCIHAWIGDRSASLFPEAVLCAGGQGVRRGSVQRSSPLHSRKTYLQASALGPSEGSLGMHFAQLLSYHLVCHSLTVAHRGRTLPQRITSVGMPFVVSGMLTHQQFIVVSRPAPLLFHRLVLSVARRSHPCRGKVCACVFVPVHFRSLRGCAAP